MSDIVITGLGAVTPVGIGVEEFWKNISSGKCGIDEIKSIDTENLPIKKAGEIKNFNPKEFLPTRLVMDMEPFMQYAFVSAEEAAKQSGLELSSNRVAVVMASALSGINIISTSEKDYVEKGRAASPKFLTKAMGNMAASKFAIEKGIKGPSLTVTTACSSGGDAVYIASMLLKSGACDAAVVMGGEASICPTMVQSLYKTGALSQDGESRPFDKNRNGFVPGEGGGAIILETKESAEKRGAKVLAKLLGCANNNDAFNAVQPEPNGEGAGECMELALKSAGIEAKDVDYINAHGTATPMGDTAEANAIHHAFKGLNPLVSSTKGATGHMMGAGGITELIACIKAVETGIVPPNTGCAEVDETLGLNVITQDGYKADINIALSNAMGFGGQNSCVVVGRNL